MSSEAGTSGLDPTLPLEAFRNTTSPAGGDSRLYNLNVFYNVGTRLCAERVYGGTNTCRLVTSRGSLHQPPSCC